jgi:hypothetical protein
MLCALEGESKGGADLPGFWRWILDAGDVEEGVGDGVADGHGEHDDGA